MESTLWGFRTLDSAVLFGPILLSLVLCLCVFNNDFVALLLNFLSRLAAGRPAELRRAAPGGRPSGLVVIPSLLRNEGDFNAITTTLESAATNEYPGELVIIASVDGAREEPALFARLEEWVAAYRHPANVSIYVASEPVRLGKMMAVEAGVDLMRRLVAQGRHAAFPTLYFSIDGDGTLSENALEHLAARITTPHPLTGRLRRVVSGKISIHHDLLWQGWRTFFTVGGQIHIQVAREFMVSNIARYNWKSSPQIGLPGALYCTWSEVIQQAPRYMGFMQSIKAIDWLKWWLGAPPPRFSESDPPSLPEALTGASDDTCIAFLGSIASWKDGRLTFDAPRTPLHALGRFFRSFFWERSHDYAPEARVFTYTPSTVKGLWTQRVRWNASRVECAGRFWRAFWFHWEIGLPVSAQVVLLLHTVFDVGFYYIVLPYYIFGTSRALLAFLLGYAGQTIAYSIYTVIALVLERKRAHCWRAVYCLPFASLYCIAINCFGCVVGVTKDIFLFGNTTNFAPEHTLMAGRCERIALSFRVRRFFALCLRSVLVGDVPLGWFWVGWRETKWTPSGYEGWTTRRPQRRIVPPLSEVMAAHLPAALRSPRRPRLAAAMVAGLCLVVGIPGRTHKSRPALDPVPLGRLITHVGHPSPLGDHRLRIEEPELRAVVGGTSSHLAEVQFRYLGPTAELVPLANGEARRQIGLAMRAQDTCNVVYVMWHIEPEPGIAVSVKRNPGKSTHAACGDRGYVNLPRRAGSDPPPIRRNESRRLAAELDGNALRVKADGVVVWDGELPPEARDLQGASGLRTDNGAFEVELKVSRD